MAYEISADWVKNTDKNRPPFLQAESNHEDFRNWGKVIQDILSCVLNTENGMKVTFVCANQPDCDTLRFACRSFIEDCFKKFGGHSIYNEDSPDIECYFLNSCLFVPINARKSTDIYDEIYKTFCKLLAHRCPKNKITSLKNNKILTKVDKEFNEKFKSCKDDILEKLQLRLMLFSLEKEKREEISHYLGEIEKSDVSKIKTSLDEMEITISNVIEKFKSIYGAPKVIFFLISLPMSEYENIKNETVLFPGFAKLAIKCETLPYEKNKNRDIGSKEITLYNTEENENLTENSDIEGNVKATDENIVDTIQEDLYADANSAQNMRKEQYKDLFKQTEK